jgi:hypothetical protein
MHGTLNYEVACSGPPRFDLLCDFNKTEISLILRLDNFLEHYENIMNNLSLIEVEKSQLE